MFIVSVKAFNAYMTGEICPLGVDRATKAGCRIEHGRVKSLPMHTATKPPMLDPSGAFYFSFMGGQTMQVSDIENIPDHTGFAMKYGCQRFLNEADAKVARRNFCGNRTAIALVVQSGKQKVKHLFCQPCADELLASGEAQRLNHDD